MTLIVEDGTGIANADTYVGVADHIAYCLMYGKVVSNDQAEINLRKSIDYIEAQKYKGKKEYTINMLKFPRTGVIVDGEELTDMQAQSLIVKAQNEVGLSIVNGIDPLAIKDRVTQSETFGPFSKTYMSGQAAYASNPRIMVFLEPLLLDGGRAPMHFKVITHTHYGDY